MTSAVSHLPISPDHSPLLRIGDFSRLAQVTIRALHHYEQLGLIHAQHIDPESGYRYYTLDQLPRLHRILAFKDLGFSLEQIADLLESDPTPEMMQGMLLARRAELQHEMAEAEARLDRVAARLAQIDQGDTTSDLEIVIKSVPALTIASVRSTIPTMEETGFVCDRQFAELDSWLAYHHLPPNLTMNIFHNQEYTEVDLDMESAVLLDSKPRLRAGTPNPEVQIIDLPPVDQMASLVHPFSFATLPDGASALLRWMAVSGYRVSGPIRVLHLFGHPESVGTYDEGIMEVQIPVERA